MSHQFQNFLSNREFSELQSAEKSFEKTLSVLAPGQSPDLNFQAPHRSYSYDENSIFLYFSARLDELFQTHYKNSKIIWEIAILSFCKI